jgi:hypothetical protein
MLRSTVQVTSYISHISRLRRLKRLKRPAALVAMALATTLSACSRFSPSDHTQPMVSSVKTETIVNPSASALKMYDIKQDKFNKAQRLNLKTATISDVAAPTPEPAVKSEVTFLKSEILGREFLYGSDLQYSSMTDSPGMYTQTISIGHVIAKFVEVGDRLRLVADQSYLFNSNINHPDRLINEFEIVKEDASSITVSIHQASPVLATVLGPKAPAPRTSWVRSVEFVPQGNYLLIESSIEQPDGTVAEFMESVFPRETLAKTTPLLNDRALEPLASRYRFLSGDDVFLDLPSGRTSTKVANHFAMDAKSGVIDWYVTTNIPAKYILAVKTGIEGWNRYSQKMWGRDFVRFKGVLPDGVKIGDPRYNVVNWDSVPDATAAYESQAADPLTGVQSHSLIYLPYAWVVIGQKYWKDNSPTQDEVDTTPALAGSTLLGTQVLVRCKQDLSMVASLKSRKSPDVFAMELLKQVLFHEVGHAMGLAHNFKGSLSYDPDDAKTQFTSSIMDYNQYQLEGAAYNSVESADGPLLEYDRQIISALYNKSADVKATDPIVPTCEDSEADSKDGGVDPLCIRYDAGRDPSVELVRTLELVKNPAAKLGKVHSLATALEDSVTALGDASLVTTVELAKARAAALVAQLKGVTSYYLASGAQSLNYMMRANVRMLYIFQADTLPAPYDPKAMRERATTSLLELVNLTTVQPFVNGSEAKVAAQAEAWLKSTPWYAGAPQAEKETAVAAMLAPVMTVGAAFDSAVLPKLRAAILGTLVYVTSAPFYFDANLQPVSDFEKMAVDILEKAMTEKIGTPGALRPTVERLVVAKSLMTFKKVAAGAAAIARVVTELSDEEIHSMTAQERASVRALLAVVKQ